MNDQKMLLKSMVSVLASLSVMSIEVKLSTINLKNLVAKTSSY